MVMISSHCWTILVGQILVSMHEGACTPSADTQQCVHGAAPVLVDSQHPILAACNAAQLLRLDIAGSHRLLKDDMPARLKAGLGQTAFRTKRMHTQATYAAVNACSETQPA
jgi:hypothetical protein